MQKVVQETLAQLLKEYPDTETISVSGHSLGAALALLTAYDIVDSGSNISAKGERLPVACFSFEGPRVGNPKFVESFKE
jgi:predicted lipase